MSIYSNFLKNQIGYADIEASVSDDNIFSISMLTTSGDLMVSRPTDHRSLGQVVALGDNKNPASDSFSSKELHEKSEESLNSLKQLLKHSY